MKEPSYSKKSMVLTLQLDELIMSFPIHGTPLNLNAVDFYFSPNYSLSTDFK